jgi:hypothetical protein
MHILYMYFKTRHYLGTRYQYQYQYQVYFFRFCEHHIFKF